MIDQATIDRYQSGGDLYASVLAQYGQAAADAVAAAATTGDRGNITDAIVAAKYGPNLPTSTLSIFAQQIATDPLAAPLADANNLVGNTVLSFLKNPWVLAALGGVAFFTLFDGLAILKNLVKRK